MKSCYFDRESRAMLDLHDVTAALPSKYEGVYDVWRISRMSVPPPSRGHGIAARLLQAACNDADAFNVELVLEAVADTSHENALNFEQLCAFYERRGFTHNPNMRGNMSRRPKESNALRTSG